MQSTPIDPQSSREKLAEAETALSRGDRAAALEALEQAARNDPYDEEFPLMAAMLEIDEARPDRAAELALRALEVRPFNPPAMNLLGVCCLDAGRPDLARKVLLAARRMAPALRRVKRNLRDAKHRERQSRGNRGTGERLPLPEAAIRARLAAGSTGLGVVVVLRDENHGGLADCLDSVRAAADEIVVVDARTHRTPLGCLANDVTVHDCVDDGDPCAAPNLGLRRVCRPWVLLLEADEILAAGSAETLGVALRSRRSLASTVVVRDGVGGAARHALRLTRNAPGLKCRAPFPDELLPVLLPLEGNWGLEIAAGRIELNGGAKHRRSAPETTELRSLYDDPQLEVRARVASAWDDYEGGRFESALEHCRAARKVLRADRRRRRPLELEEPVILEGVCLLRLERYAELDALIAGFHASHPETAATCFLAGCAAKGTAAPRRAVALLRRALELRGQATFAPPLGEVHGPALPNMLGAALLDLGDLDSARSSFGAAREIDDASLEARLGEIGILHAEGSIESMLTRLDDLVESHGNDTRVWIAGAILLHAEPKLAAAAVGWLEEGRRRFPADVELCRRLGEAHLQIGAVDRALESWSGLPAGAGAPAAGRVAAALAGGDEIDAERTTPSEIVGWFQRWLVTGAIEALDRALVEIRRAEDAVPGLGDATAAWLDRVGQPEAAENVRRRIDRTSDVPLP